MSVPSHKGQAGLHRALDLRLGLRLVPRSSNTSSETRDSQPVVAVADWQCQQYFIHGKGDWDSDNVASKA